MNYRIKITHRFWKSAEFLKTKYPKEEVKAIIAEIEESILILRHQGSLPQEYDDHILRRSPFVGQHEYHVYDDDILIIYSKHENKKLFRFIMVLDHEMLNEISEN